MVLVFQSGVQIILGKRMGDFYDSVVDKRDYYYHTTLLMICTYFLVLISYFVNQYLMYILVAIAFGVAEMRIKIFINGGLAMRFP
jgi:hypothetical protein